MDYSLMYPTGSNTDNKTLTDEAVNDLSINFIVEALTDVKSERELICSAMKKITDDPEVIRYRCDVFDFSINGSVRYLKSGNDQKSSTLN